MIIIYCFSQLCHALNLLGLAMKTKTWTFDLLWQSHVVTSWNRWRHYDKRHKQHNVPFILSNIPYHMIHINMVDVTTYSLSVWFSCLTLWPLRSSKDHAICYYFMLWFVIWFPDWYFLFQISCVLAIQRKLTLILYHSTANKMIFHAWSPVLSHMTRHAVPYRTVVTALVLCRTIAVLVLLVF